MLQKRKFYIFILQFHAETGKPRVFSNIFNQQRKTTFDNVRVTAFPPFNTSISALLLAKLELGGARLNSSSVSSGGGAAGGMFFMVKTINWSELV